MCKSSNRPQRGNKPKLCSTKKCKKPLLARGLCAFCYDKARRAGDFGSGEKCEEPFCQRKKSTEKFCHTCYKRHLSRLRGVKPLKVRGTCTTPGCGRPHHSKGLCGKCRDLKKSRANGSKPKKFSGKSLAITHPRIAKLMVDQLAVNFITAGSSKIYDWVCPLGHHFTNNVKDVIRGDGRKYGCSICHGKKVVPGINDLATVDKELAIFLCNPKDGESVTIKSRKILMWECYCGASYPLSVQERSRAKKTGNTGCPTCPKSGHRKGVQSIFYLISRPGQFKIGIMNTRTTRLNQHRSKGWTVIEKIMMDGELARMLETKIKRLLKKNGVATGADAFSKRFDGFSEAWRAVDLNVTSIEDMLKKLGTSFEALLAD